MLALALGAGDRIGAAVISIVAAALIAFSWWGFRPGSKLYYRRIYLLYAIALGIFSFIMVNWRFHSWLAGASGKDIEKIRQAAPLWGMNLLLAVLWIAIVSMMWVTMPTWSDHEPASA
jgi:hypothetical protein